MNLSQFKDWALSQGSVATPIGTHKGECVSLIQQYLYKVYGIPFTPRGHAKDWSTNTDVLSNFAFASEPQAGDILVYNTGDAYGHIEIYLGNNLSLEQNRGLDKKVHVRSLFTKYPYVILRRKGGKNMNPTRPQIARIWLLANFADLAQVDAQTRENIYSFYEQRNLEVLLGDLSNGERRKQVVEQFLKGNKPSEINKASVIDFISKNLK